MPCDYFGPIPPTGVITRWHPRSKSVATGRWFSGDLGVHPGNVVSRAGLPADLFARPNVSVSAEQYFRLWDALEIEMGDRPLALEIGQGVSVESFSPPVFAALCSPDLNTAAMRLSRFKPLVGPLALDVEVGPRHTTLAYESIGVRDLPPSLGLAELVFLVSFARLATREYVVPKRVSMPKTHRG